MNQVLAAVQSGIQVEPRTLAAKAVTTAKTRLEAACLLVEDRGDGSLIVDEAYVYWPATNTWRGISSLSNRGYGIDTLIAAATTEAVAKALDGYVE